MQVAACFIKPCRLLTWRRSPFHVTNWLRSHRASAYATHAAVNVTTALAAMAMYSSGVWGTLDAIDCALVVPLDIISFLLEYAILPFALRFAWVVLWIYYRCLQWFDDVLDGLWVTHPRDESAYQHAWSERDRGSIGEPVVAEAYQIWLCQMVLFAIFCIACWANIDFRSCWEWVPQVLTCPAKCISTAVIHAMLACTSGISFSGSISPPADL